MEKFWKIKNEAEAESAEILLYGAITTEKDLWTGEKIDEADKGVAEFAEELHALGGKNVTLRINSPGGDVFQAQAIYNQIKSYSGTVNTVIDGMCASAATLVALAGNKITMPRNGIFMIHNPMVGYRGAITKAECERISNALDAIKQTIVNVYMGKCKNASEADVKRMMDDETWLSADECLAYGFIDEITEDMDTGNSTYLNCVAYANENYSNYSYVCDNSTSVNGKMKNKVQPEGVNDMENNSNWLNDLKSLFKATNDVDNAVKAERERINCLNKLRNGNEAVDRIVDIAIDKGNSAEEIKEYVDAVSGIETASNGIDEIKAIVADQLNSGAANVAVNASDNVSGNNDSNAASAGDIDKLAGFMKSYLNSTKR